MGTSAGRDWTALVLALQNKDKIIQELRGEVAIVQKSLISRNSCINYLHAELTRIIISLKGATNIKNGAVEMVGSAEMDISTMLSLSGDLFEEVAQKRFESKFTEMFRILDIIIAKSTNTENDLRQVQEALEYSHHLVTKSLHNQISDPQDAAHTTENHDTTGMMRNVVRNVDVGLNSAGRGPQFEEWEATPPPLGSDEITDQDQSDTTIKNTEENGWVSNKENDTVRTGVETSNMEQSVSSIQSDCDAENSANFSKPTQSQKPYYYCQVCGKTYRSQGGLKIHIGSKHSLNMPVWRRKTAKGTRGGRGRKRIAVRKTPQTKTLSDTSSSTQGGFGFFDVSAADEYLFRC